MSQVKEEQHVSPSRRRFMQLGATAGGGLLFGFSLFGCSKEDDRKEPPPEKAVGQASTEHSDTAPGLARDAFIRIDRTGLVTLVIHKVEMGQGTFTSMPMLLAEELGADLSKVKLEQAPANNELYADPLLGGQVTGGSTSVRGAWKPLREAGAMVRSVLVSAAAQNWNVDTADLQVVAGTVRHQASGRSAHFGELVDAASKMELPKNVKLKDPEQFVLIGKAMKRLDSPAKVNGTAQFGIDARLPNMPWLPRLSRVASWSRWTSRRRWRSRACARYCAWKARWRWWPTTSGPRSRAWLLRPRVSTMALTARCRSLASSPT